MDDEGSLLKEFKSFCEIFTKKFGSLKNVRTFAIPFGKHTEKSEGICGNSSVGRAQPCQGWGREFESRFPLQKRSLRCGLKF